MGVPLKCTKMSGLGNDFVVIDLRHDELDTPLPPCALRRIACRSSGIGCDQVIVLARHATLAALVRVYNGGSGEEGGVCGNAFRCVGHLLIEETHTDRTQFMTMHGNVITVCRTDAASRFVSVDMGVPVLDWAAIPLAEQCDTLAVPIPCAPLPSPVAINVGNPHLVFLLPLPPDPALVHRHGPPLEVHPMLPQHANISFAHMSTPHLLHVMTWERGAGLTSACGTGACASVVAAVRRGVVGSDVDVTVKMTGGDLVIRWRSDDGHIIMTGGYDYDGDRIIPPQWLQMENRY